MNAIVNFAKQNENFKIPPSLYQKMIIAGFQPEDHLSKINHKKIEKHLVRGGATPDLIKKILPIIAAALVCLLFFNIRKKIIPPPSPPQPSPPQPSPPQPSPKKETLNNTAFTRVVPKICVPGEELSSPSEYTSSIKPIIKKIIKEKFNNFIRELVNIDGVVVDDHNRNYFSAHEKHDINHMFHLWNINNFKKYLKFKNPPNKVDYILKWLQNGGENHWYKSMYEKYLSMEIPQYVFHKEFPEEILGMLREAKNPEEQRFLQLRHTATKNDYAVLGMLQKIKQIKEAKLAPKTTQEQVINLMLKNTLIIDRQQREEEEYEWLRKQIFPARGILL